MNKNKLKSYAPAARRAFIQAVTDRAHFWGLSEKRSEPVEERGDVAIISGRAFPRKVATQIKGLAERVKRDGFEQVMEAVAYTWFNRFMAIRYMEIHGYFEHGFTVLSNPNGSAVPQILEQVAHVRLSGLNQDEVIALKLDGTKDAELYRMLLVAQCNALHEVMPFLFEKINDETELLLPDNLLHSDSLIRKLVTEIDEDDWQEVEIIGWLYQFYISEKKDQVIGKVVKSEDIPAATQLFTPNWIVKYMVQNSLGRMWLATYPDSPLKAKMEYYIEPAEQTDEVKAQLVAITPDSLDPEVITFMDPANGSGHILVEAYDLFKEMYLERGYRTRDIPRLILEKNLYGLDIDDRAAQMAGFALLMKARKDDRQILQGDNPVKLNVMGIQESEGRGGSGKDSGKNSGEWTVDSGEDSGQWLVDSGQFFSLGVNVSKQDIAELVELFRHGKTFGSLITVPEPLAEKLPAMARLVEENLAKGDLFAEEAARSLQPFVRQAVMLARKYDCVVANPPYMGSKGMNTVLKGYAKERFPDSKSDLFAMFIERGFELAKVGTGYNAQVTMQSWMFLSSFELMREKLLTNRTIITMAHLGARAFTEISGEVVQTTTFVLQERHFNGFRPVFFRLVDGQEEQKEASLRSGQNRFDTTIQDEFQKIPGNPIAYWASNTIREIFNNMKPLNAFASVVVGLQTGDNNVFVRFWTEVDLSKIGFCIAGREEALTSSKKWFPYNKGGDYRKWYGNAEFIVNWFNDGIEVKNFGTENGGKARSRPQNMGYYFSPSIAWSFVSSSYFGVRYYPQGFIFDVAGSSAFPKKESFRYEMVAFLCSCLAPKFMSILNPTLNFQVGNVEQLPFKEVGTSKLAYECIEIAKSDWNSFEASWDFQSFPWLPVGSEKKVDSTTTNHCPLTTAWLNWQAHCTSQIKRMQELETENNRVFIEAYGLQDEITPDVPEDQITLARANREQDMKYLISYAIGCMMGRYRLDRPGLIYAHGGNDRFWDIYEEVDTIHSLPPDDDGIIPITDMDWFPDDAANRFEEFLKMAWLPETLEENLKFVADSLSPRSGETPRETMRRYISTQFFKDHLQTYKKRPIYWLFSSGKLRAFECLVYLHRYNEATLSRMRNEYVTPLQGKLSARVEYLAHEIDSASTTSVRNKLQKELDTIKKKQTELAAFDDLLRHYADQRISLDLDDGVKVNYGKFGNLLAEVKTVTGSSE